MNQQQFKKRTQKLIQMSKVKTKGQQSDNIIKQLSDVFKLEPNCQQLSGFLNELNLSLPNLVNDSKMSILEPFILSTPIQYLGYVSDFLRIDIGRFKGIQKKLEEQLMLNYDYEQLKSSRDKNQVLRNATNKIQRVLPLLRSFKRRLRSAEALRIIAFLPLDTTNQKKIFMQLSEMLKEEVLNVKWEQIYQLLNQSIPTAGHYGVLIGIIDKNHNEIADGIMRMIRTSKDMENCLRAFLSECLAPGLLKVIGVIVRKIFSIGDTQMVVSFFERIAKPILLPNFQTSKYFKEIQTIFKHTLVKTRQTVYPLRQIDVVPNQTRTQNPTQHINLLIEVANIWVSPNQRNSTINRLQKLLSSIKRKDLSPFSKTQTNISQPSSISQLSTSSKAFHLQDSRTHQQHPKLSINSQKVLAPSSSQVKHRKSMDEKVIMFECDDYIGIPNVGNTCYINSFIQNLLFCKQFMNIFMKSNIQKHTTYHLLKKILQQLKQLNNNKLKQLLIEFKKQLPTTFSIDDAQQDSMEFGRELINGLMSVPELTNIIKQIFITKTKMITQCPNGDISSSMEESNTEMILAFQHPLIVSKLKTNTQITPLRMDDLLNAYFADNQIQGQFKCDKCKKKFNKCLRITELLDLPQTLIIVLSRFMYDVNLQKKRKILDVVSLEDYIHFGNINTNSKIKAQYKLTSFVVHMGNQAESGHYQVYVKHPKEEECWVVFDDDNSVMQVSCASAKSLAQNLAVEESPYILFYSRIG